ncbi:uncharacterized protein LOC114269850 [Camellia sinensis]|uniref:uncharacterized protein LOC114269850 n=1 Tax=Camellia sinensis TaxID=4442 RepID=UPI0010365F95|nr:uncharacterized protein LOC114269850 [Camellia sinensis]
MEDIDLLQENVEIKVRNGRRIMFWEDAWKGSYCLKDKYPRLFSISIDKGVTLKKMIDRKDSLADWILRFRRNLRIWEDEELRILKDELGSGPSLCLFNLDSISWKEGSSGCFSAKAAYNWRIKSFDLLQKIGVVESNGGPSCVLCRSGKESLNHIMLHCPFSWKVWSSIIKGWGVKWIIPDIVERLFQWWNGWKFKKGETQIWKAIPLAVLWSVWKHRNDVIFNKVQPNMEELYELIKVVYQVSGQLWAAVDLCGQYGLQAASMLWLNLLCDSGLIAKVQVKQWACQVLRCCKDFCISSLVSSSDACRNGG